MKNIFRIIAIAGLLILPGLAIGAEKVEPSKQQPSVLPQDYVSELDFLLSVLPAGGESVYSLDRISGLLDFIRKGTDSHPYYIGKTSNISYAYSAFEISRPLDQVIAYMYNPDIPAVAFSPSAVRLSYWSEVDGKKQPLPPLWKDLKTRTKPVFVRGSSM